MTVRPWVTLVAIAIVTLMLAAGVTQRAPVAENEAFLPRDSAVAKALEEIETLFGHSDVVVVTLVFRGEVLTPDGLAQMDGLLGRIVSTPGVGELLPPVDAVAAPTLLMKPLLQVTDFDSVAQEQIDAVLDHVRATPELQPARTVLDMMTGTDTDGTTITVATIRLRDTGDEAVNDAQLAINDLAEADEGPLSVRSVSLAVIEEEYKEATGPGVLPLMGLALLVIALLTLLFMRTLSDLLLTLTGLVLALIWTVGAESWLGPGALGLIGPPNALTATVPLILIGLAVDYSIQAVSHYREQRIAGEPVAVAVVAGAAERHHPAGAGRCHHDRKFPGEPALADLGDRGLRRGGGAWRRVEPDRDADAGPSRANNHRRASRGPRTASSSSSDRECDPGHPPASGKAGDIRHAEAGALPLCGGCGDGRVRVRGLADHHRIHYPRRPAQGRELAQGSEFARCGGRRLNGSCQRPGQGRGDRDTHPPEPVRHYGGV